MEIGLYFVHGGSLKPLSHRVRSLAMPVRSLDRRQSQVLMFALLHNSVLWCSVALPSRPSASIWAYQSVTRALPVRLYKLEPRSLASKARPAAFETRPSVLETRPTALETRQATSVIRQGTSSRESI